MQLAIVGVGKLGLSLLTGVVNKGVIAPNDIGILEANTERAQDIASRLGVRILTKEQLGQAGRILICVQPRMFSDIAPWLAQENVGYISTMAGVSAGTIGRRLGTRRVVRVMPNLAATIGRSQTAVTAPREAHDAGGRRYLVQRLVRVWKVGETV